MSDFRLQYAKMIAQTGAFAAWDPVINGFAVGDYGFVDEFGIFHKIGSLQKNHGIGVKIKQTSTEKLSIGCATASRQEIQVDGCANLPQAAGSGVSGTLSLKFSREESCLIRTRGDLIARSMDDLPDVAKKVFDIADWDHNKTYIVQRVDIAESPLILISSGKNAEVKLSGSVDALKAIQAGSASANVRIANTSGVQYHQLTEKSGPVAVHLFRVKKEPSNPEKYYIKPARPGKRSSVPWTKRRTPMLPAVKQERRNKWVVGCALVVLVCLFVLCASGLQHHPLAQKSGPLAVRLFWVKRERTHPVMHYYIKHAMPRQGKKCLAWVKRRTPALPSSRQG